MKSKTHANIALTVALLCWIPLFNFILGPLALYHAIRSLLKKKESDQKTIVKAVVSFVIGAFVTVLSILYVVNYVAGGALENFCSDFMQFR